MDDSQLRGTDPRPSSEVFGYSSAPHLHLRVLLLRPCCGQCEVVVDGANGDGALADR
jgi:hypothetical protein